MLTITIKKVPTSRLFDRMPMPKTRVRTFSISRHSLAKHSLSPFQTKITRIK